MVGLVLSRNWPRYHASSPFLNLLNSSHPRFEIIPILPHELLGPEIREKLNSYEALVTDDINAHVIGFFNNGPKLMVGGDPHAHRMDQVSRLENEYSCVDYVLTGAVFCKRLVGRYLYPRAEIWKKHVYFPHMVPDHHPLFTPWEGRYRKGILSGNKDPAVYPYRAEVAKLARHYPQLIDVLDMHNHQHHAYFEHVSKYRIGVTCNSNFEYTVAKYFEIPWTGTVLVAPPPTKEESELIGFKAFENCDFIENPGSVKNALDVWLYSANSPTIATAGQELMKRHTAHRRLDYIALLIDKIKQGGFSPDDAKDIFLKHRKGEHGG